MYFEFISINETSLNAAKLLWHCKEKKNNDL